MSTNKTWNQEEGGTSMDWMARLVEYLDGRSKAVLWVSVAISLAVLGIIDYATGAELASSLFYLLPLMLASWTLGSASGRLVAVMSALIWQISNLLAGEKFASPFVPVWNTLVRLVIFLIFGNLTSEIRNLLKRQTELSRLDELTGVLNKRAFYEAADNELKRMRRSQRPLSAIFIDVDDFKAINDAHGHRAGDMLLRHLAERLQHHLRGTDIVGRMGGDEYAAVLPEMTCTAAQKVIPRLRKTLQDEIAQSDWPVTVSVGVLSCESAPPDAEDMIQRADTLMYAAKRAGKNRVEYGSYSIQTAPAEET
jgi:diguanylate cyclase (GGDEF)-like protein